MELQRQHGCGNACHAQLAESPSWSQLIPGQHFLESLPSNLRLRKSVCQTQGPIFTTDWFGTRETWAMEVQDNDRVLFEAQLWGMLSMMLSLPWDVEGSELWDAFTLRGSDARVGH